MFSTGTSYPSAPATVDLIELLTPEYPHVLSESTRALVNVPLPREHDPEWTTDVPRFQTAPRSFDGFKHLPDPSQPAYYAAAVDTIRVTNFRLTQHDTTDHPLRRAHVKQSITQWRSDHTNRLKYPLPPDRRTLYVEVNDQPPMRGATMWTKACEEWAAMNALDKAGYLSKTRAQHIRENELEGSGTERDDKLYLRIFKRYLAWRQHVLSKDNKVDVQPSRSELIAFFKQSEVQRNGVTLADICHAFPNAWDTQMLVYRIEGLAEYMSKPDKDGEPVESVYMPKSAPAELEVEKRIREVLLGEGPMPLTEILKKLYPFGFGYERLIADILKDIAIPNVTGNGFGLASHPYPPVSQISIVMSVVTGRRLIDLQQRFSDNLLKGTDLTTALKEIAYEDDHDKLWYLRFSDAVGHGVDGIKNNKRLRLEKRLEVMLNEHSDELEGMLNDLADWDETREQYVRKPQQDFKSSSSHPPPSPTVVGTPPRTSSAPSPPQIAVASAPMASSSDHPDADASAPSSHPRASSSHTHPRLAPSPFAPFDPTPSVSAPAAPSASASPARSSSASKRSRPENDNDDEQDGRSSKRSRSATSQQEEPVRVQMIRCNGTTQKNKLCKLKSRRPVGEAWNCGKHK